jgi:hypothetical protein
MRKIFLTLSASFSSDIIGRVLYYDAHELGTLFDREFLWEFS